MHFFQFRIAVVVMLLNEINIATSNILNSPFALLLCSPEKKKCINCVFHFPWVFPSRTVNVFQALHQTSQTIKMYFEKLLGFRTRFLKGKLQSVLISFKSVHPCPLFRGNPMDLFLKISVLEANFCWVGDVEEIICSWKESVAGKNIIQGDWVDLMSRISFMCYVSETSPTRPLPTTEGLNFALRPHPNWPVIFGHTSAGKLPNKSGCRL